MASIKGSFTRGRLFGTVVEIDRARVAPLLPSGLTPRRLYGDRCGLFVQFLEVMESNVGAFKECTVSAVCKEKLPWPPAGAAAWCSDPAFTLWVGVTSPLAQQYGREVWGYPKHTADVKIDDDGERFVGSVVTPEGISVACSALIPRELEPSEIELRSISSRLGKVLLAPMRGAARFATTWDPQASYDVELRPLGIDRLQGISSFGIYADELSLELPEPIVRPTEANT